MVKTSIVYFATDKDPIRDELKCHDLQSSQVSLWSSTQGLSVPIELFVKIQALNRGLCYGHGAFETIAVKHGAAGLLERHLERLGKSMVQLGLMCDMESLTLCIESFLADHFAQMPDAVLRVQASGGLGQRGYASPGVISTVLTLALFPPAQPMTSLNVVGLNLPILQNQPAHLGLKSTSALQYVSLANEALLNDCQQGILFSESGQVIEATQSSILIIRQDGSLVTPLRNGYGVNGVMISYLLETFSVLQACPLLEQNMQEIDILQAQMLFLVNSVFGLMPVDQYISRSQTQTINFQPVPIQQRVSQWPWCESLVQTLKKSHFQVEF